MFLEVSKRINKRVRTFLESSEFFGIGGIYNKLNNFW